MLLLEQRARVSRRAIVMEYINFILSIAAVGLCFVLLQKNRSRTHAGSLFLTKPRGSGANAGPAPPLKKTVSGPSEKELEALEMEAQVEKWRKADPIQRRWSNRSADPLSGKKYAYVPPQKSRTSISQAAQRKISTSPNGNKFHLIG
jgi:hypothetical protein